MADGRIATVEDLERIKRARREAVAAAPRRLLLCAGAGCVSAKCFAVRDAVAAALRAAGLAGTIPLDETGCLGACAKGPTLVVEPDGVLYVALKPEDAAKIVGLHESITALPLGYDTPAAEAAFSQGQFQLLSIARAVAASPKILLLDEVTANLDSGTEARVMDALERAARGRTVLSISHRLHECGEGGRVIRIGGCPQPPEA